MAVPRGVEPPTFGLGSRCPNRENGFPFQSRTDDENAQISQVAGGQTRPGDLTVHPSFTPSSDSSPEPAFVVIFLQRVVPWAPEYFLAHPETPPF
jgi:hypothetical protein